MVSQNFYKYLKVFEKKKSERIPIRKTWDYAINFREGFVSEKKGISIIQNKERGDTGVLEGSVEEEIYLTIKITIDVSESQQPIFQSY